jgi:ABC-type amino acid transport substrate-binding protein
LETGIIRAGIRVWPEATFSPPAFRGFSNAETGGALNGFEVDIAHLLADRLGLELELVEAYPPVIAGGDWRGEWDIALASLVPFDQPPEMRAGQPQTELFFSRPYAYMPMGLLIPADENNIQTIGDLPGSKVGVLEYSPYQRLIMPNGRSLTVQDRPLLSQQIPADIEPVLLSSLSKAIRRLGQPENGEPSQPDAIFGPTPILQQAVKNDFPVKLVPQAETIGFLPLAVAVVPQEELKVDRLLLEINKILEQLHKQGTLAEVYQRWYGQDLSQIPSSESTATP